MNDLTNRVVVITGAANGIGRSLAEEFAKAGCRLALADVEEAAVEAVAAGLRASGATAVARAIDVTRPDQLARFAGEVKDQFGGADILINNAGVALPGRSLARLTADDWRWIIDVNLMGAVHAIAAFMAQLQDSSRAHVVNMSSMTAFDAGPYNAPYCASKAGLMALSESLALECEAEVWKIGVSVICPGAVKTTINQSEGRRSADYGGHSAEMELPPAMREFLAAAASVALEPEAVAGQVLAAVQDGRFYVVTHASSTDRILRRGLDATSPAGALSRRG